MNQSPTILAVESSCDDTSIAIIQDAKVLSNVVSSQKEHENFGGVVPEMASRKHLENIDFVLDRALSCANVSLDQLDAVAFTKGPGLRGSLIVGANFAKGLSLGLDIPLIGVHHMKAHILAHFIEDPKPVFPFLCLTVSGGHTQIVLVKSPMEMEVLGNTLDDAAGEAFDKGGKMLGLQYPAGPIIDSLAKKGKVLFQFSRPNIDGYDFSFSGMKTSLLYFLQKKVKDNSNFVSEQLDNVCASFQHDIVEVLLEKLFLAVENLGIRVIAMAGGVSANSYLRKKFEEYGKSHNCQTFVPRFEYCTDNAAMVAMHAHFLYLEGEFESISVEPHPNLSF